MAIHTLLWVGTLYPSKIKLLQSLGATSECSIVYSKWAADAYDETWDVEETEEVPEVADLDLEHPTCVILDELDLKLPHQQKRMLALFGHPMVTVFYITKHLRSMYPDTRSHFLRVFAIGRFQHDKIFRLVYPSAPVGEKNELVQWWGKGLDDHEAIQRGLKETQSLATNISLPSG